MCSSARAVLLSIIYQLNKIFPTLGITADKEPTVETLKEHIVKSLSRIKEPIVFAFDAIDQFDEADYDLGFVFEKVPAHVKVVYSVLTKRDADADDHKLHKLFDDLTHRIRSSSNNHGQNHLELKCFDAATAKHLLHKWLAQLKRKITAPQSSALDQFLSQRQKEACGTSPLHLRLILQRIAAWKSSYEPRDILHQKCSTISDTIKSKLYELEGVYGRVLLSHAIFYLTVLRNGVSETEIEDILSIDDEVLSDVFEHENEPPVRRFPIALWLRLRAHLGALLVEKEANAAKVLSWRHESVAQAADEYCADAFAVLRMDVDMSQYRDSVLMNVVDYFNETWNARPKEFRYGKAARDRLKKVGDSQKRNTKPQQMIFYAANGAIKGVNGRKLSEFVDVTKKISNKVTQIHLLLISVYFDFGFMVALIRKMGDRSFFADVKNALRNGFLIENRDKLDLLGDINSLYKDLFR